MARLGSVALITLFLPTAAWGDAPAPDPKSALTRSFHLPRPSADFRDDTDERFGRTQIAPNAHFGVGMFGLKPEKSPLRPATVREIDAPKQRRAAVGFSLRF